MTGKGGSCFSTHGHHGRIAGLDDDVGLKGNEHRSLFPAVEACDNGLTSLNVKAGLLGWSANWFSKFFFCSSSW
jgi:hypothetical protein